MKAFKGFNKDMTCRGFQFEEGSEYEEDSAEVCRSGFHACTSPLDVFGYYEPASSVYHEVEVDDDAKGRDDDDSKVASRRIRIGASVDLIGLAKAHVEFVRERVDESQTQSVVNSAASNTGDYSAASNTGYRSAASNTGHYSAASNTGDYSAASNTGDYSAASNTGDYSAASNTGYRSAASNTGYRSAASNTGHYSAASNTGHRSAASNTGHRSAASNTGDYSAASVEGKDSVALASGYRGRVKGAPGCALMIVERDDDYHIIAAKAVIVGQKSGGRMIKPGVWYALLGGRVVEVDDSGEPVTR